MIDDEDLVFSWRQMKCFKQIKLINISLLVTKIKIKILALFGLNASYISLW